MPYKIIALDMDGTLLPPNKKIPLRTRKYLHRLTKEGYYIVLASGRPNRALEFYHHEIESNAPIVCYNGAFVFHPTDPNFPKYYRYMDSQEILSIYNACLKRGIISNFLLETDIKTWVMKKDEYLANFFWLENHDIIYGDLNKTLKENTITAIFKLIRSPQNDAFIEMIIKKHPNLTYRYWGKSEYCEFYAKGTSKADGLRHVCKYYGLTMKDVVAFGDSYNDVEMLDESGLGIVMNDAKKEMLANYQEVSLKGHRREGVMRTLKKILK